MTCLTHSILSLTVDLLIPIDSQRFALSRIVAVMRHEALAGEDVEFAIAIQIDERGCVGLRPGIVDQSLGPLIIRALFEPHDSVIMGIGGNDVISAIAIHVGDIHKAEGSAAECRMKSPLGLWIRRRFEPAFRSKDVIASVFIYIAGADAVAVAIGVYDVLDELAVFDFVPG